MNKLFFIFACTTTFISCKPELKEESKSNLPVKNIPCLPANLTSHVIAFYPFSNGSLNDFSGNSNNLTNLTSAIPSPDRSGNTSCAYEFNNSSSPNEYLSAQNSSFLNGLKDFSISLWYKPKAPFQIGNDAKLEGLISRGTIQACPDKLGEWSLGLYDCRKVVFGRENSAWDNQIKNTCEDEIVDRTNVWKHVVGTYDAKNKVISIYVDGVFQNAKTGEGCSQNSGQILDLGDLYLGYNYTGCIDDVVIFNKLLDATEVNSLFQTTTCCGVTPAN